MASDRLPPTLADYVVVVVSPALIMGMVGSLAFFILEVMYRGAYETRLQWTVFFFIFGAVLVGRVSMIGEIAGRYWIYAPILGLLTLLVLQTFIEYPADNSATRYRAPINLLLVLVVLWSTYMLMWDCTHIDTDGEPTAQGLLEAAGLEQGPPPIDDEAREKEEAKDPRGIWGWITRYRRYRDKKKRRRVLGVWVVYFALAALPLFGLGQALIDPGDVVRRRVVFWLMSLYAGSALGLLLTTCFLGIRRYLRQRHVKMPAAMTSVWLTSGGVLVLVLLILGALLPRPNAEYRLIDLTPLGKEGQQASKHGLKKEGSGKDQGDPGDKPGESNKGDSRGGKDKPKEAGAKDGKDGKSSDGEKQSGGKSKGKGESKLAEPKAAEPKAGQRKDEIAEILSEKSSALKDAVLQLKVLIKMLAFMAVGLIVAMVLLTGGLRYLSNFTQWARELLEWLQNLWKRLFGSAEQKKKARKKKRATAMATEYEDRPFSSFQNPWSDGTADQRTLQELIRFTFAALQAWAAERGVLRELAETPLEFAARIGEETPPLTEDVDRFIDLYLRAEYARGKLPADRVDEVRQFWDRLEQAVEQPLSA